MQAGDGTRLRSSMAIAAHRTAVNLHLPASQQLWFTLPE